MDVKYGTMIALSMVLSFAIFVQGDETTGNVNRDVPSTIDGKTCIVPITYNVQASRNFGRGLRRSNDSDFAYFTIVNSFPTGADESYPYYQCMMTSSSTGNTSRFLYDRYAPTRNIPSGRKNAVAHKQLPPANETIDAVVVNLNPNDVTGIYFCSAYASGGRKTIATTTVMSGNAKIFPVDGRATTTVSLGDTDVSIDAKLNEEQVEPTAENIRTLKWRKNDVFTNSIKQGRLSYTFHHPITPNDAGVYECYVNGERNTGLTLIKRLIVRGCPVKRWGPPSCVGVCDKCYNGGVCDEVSGRCVCPPGFSGKNCLTACGENLYGRDCEMICNDTSRFREACKGLQFCLPDPYGCSCGPGYTGLDCLQECETGFYGAGCTQPCHCISGNCDKFTGECLPSELVTSTACHDGWSGRSCQIPDVCERGYYGDQCTEQCYCLQDLGCEKSSGKCPEDESQAFKIVVNASFPCNNTVVVEVPSDSANLIEGPRIGEVSNTPSSMSAATVTMFVVGFLVVMGIFLVLHVAMFIVLRHHDKIIKQQRRNADALEFTNRLPEDP